VLSQGQQAKQTLVLVVAVVAVVLVAVMLVIVLQVVVLKLVLVRRLNGPAAPVHS
jgi:hypothetical protein